MIISDSHKFIFHHLPKTAGTSITVALAPYCNKWEGALPEQTHGWQVKLHEVGMHTRLREIDSEPNYFSFAFVRNPFDVIASAWDPTEDKDFDEFIEKRILTGIEICDRQSQYEHLSSKDETLLVDFVGRYENLAKDFYKVIDAIEVPLMRLPKFNIGKKGKERNYRKFYSTWSREKIEKIFEKDLKNFGYGFENE